VTEGRPFVSWSGGSPDGLPEGSSAEGTPSPAEPPGELAARFEVLDVLGRGGMGVVYRARDVESGREVALKVLRPGRERSDELRKRLRREGELTAGLHHPGIVGVHAAGETEGRAWLAYELVEGARTLEEALAQGPEPARALEWIRQVAEATAHAHARGVVHRDLKPANVLIDAADRARVADFGLAWAVGAESLTRSDAIVGTPSYLPPERLAQTGDPRAPTGDVWALGILLYRALAGRSPYSARTLAELAAQVTGSDPPPPSRSDPGIPAALDAVCRRALARRPAERYPDAGAFARDLAGALEGGPVLALRARRRRLLLLLGAAVVGAALLLGLHRPAPPAEPGADVAAAIERAAAGAPRARAELGRLLERAELPARLAARAHLALAAAPADGAGADADAAAWRERLAHAERAAALAPPALAPSVARARAAALAALGRPVEAGRAYLAAGRADEARAALAAAGGEGASPAAALLAAALARAAGRDPHDVLGPALARWPDEAGLRAAAARAALLAGRPAAARDLLERPGGEPVAAGAWGDLARRLTAAPPGRLPDLAGLEAAPADLRLAAARALLADARRELALRDREADPRQRVPRTLLVGGRATRHGEPPGAAERTRRAEAAVALARRLSGVASVQGRAAVLAARALDPGEPRALSASAAAFAARPADPAARRALAAALLARDRPATAAGLVAGLAGPAAAHLRGRAALARGDPAAAAEALADAWIPERLDPAVARDLLAALEALGHEDAAAVRTRLERLEGARREEALALLQELRDRGELEAERIRTGCRRVLELDPLQAWAWVYLGRARFFLGEPVAGLSDCTVGLSRAPYLLGHLFRSLIGLKSTTLGDAASVTGRLPELPARTRGERLTRALVRTFAVELEGAGAETLAAARADAEAVLAEDPGELVAWQLLGFLEVRSGRLHRAERALAVAADAMPEAALVAFYRALLAAARGAPAAEVGAGIDRAVRRGFAHARERVWDAELYPELAPYLTAPPVRDALASGR